MFLCPYCLLFLAFTTGSEKLNWALTRILEQVHAKECEAQLRLREYGELQ